MSRATVRFWIRRFNAHGPVGLYEAPRGGRPRKRGPQGLETLLRRLQDDPRHAGYRATFWTIAMRALALFHKRGVHLSVSAPRVGLRERGLRWGRPLLFSPRC